MENLEQTNHAHETNLKVFFTPMRVSKKVDNGQENLEPNMKDL